MAHYVAEKIALKSSIHAATVKISQQMVARSTSTHAQQNNFYSIILYIIIVSKYLVQLV